LRQILGKRRDSGDTMGMTERDGNKGAATALLWLSLPGPRSSGTCR